MVAVGLVAVGYIVELLFAHYTQCITQVHENL